MKSVTMKKFPLKNTLLLLLCGLLPAHAAWADEAGSVTSASGTVSHVHAGATQAAAVGQELDVGDELDTGGNGRVEFQLADGSLVSLTPNSRFVINQYDYDEKGQRPGLGLFSLFTGSMRAVTGAISRFQHRVEVTTPVATIGIRGTEFVGEIGEQGMDVSMLEGTGVSVRNPQGEQVELNQAGHSTHLGFQRLADGRYEVGHPEAPRILRAEELGRLQQRVDWIDHNRRERVRALRAHFERFDRAHKEGEPIQPGPRFRGGRWGGEGRMLRAEGFRPLAMRSEHQGLEKRSGEGQRRPLFMRRNAGMPHAGNAVLAHREHKAEHRRK